MDHLEHLHNNCSHQFESKIKLGIPKLKKEGQSFKKEKAFYSISK